MAVMEPAVEGAEVEEYLPSRAWPEAVVAQEVMVAWEEREEEQLFL